MSTPHDSTPSAIRRLILLGPQPQYRSLREAVGRLQLSGRLALVTAGWEEDETQDEPIRSAISQVTNSCEVANLVLFRRSEQLFADDPELIQSLQQRQDELRHLRDAYRVRLDLLLEAARKTLSSKQEPVDLGPERESAIEMVRQLDRQYFIRTSQICDDYEQRLQTVTRPSVAGHRADLDQLLAESSAIVVSGGHAAIILNRLRIFDVLKMNPTLPIIAWSGGAMALADQIVFFHDSPPQGAGNAEVLRAGMGLFSEILPLPAAHDRLKLEDHLRVAMFARRFNCYWCVAMDENTLMDREDGVWWVNDGTKRLGTDGNLTDVQP